MRSSAHNSPQRCNPLDIIEERKHRPFKLLVGAEFAISFSPAVVEYKVDFKIPAGVYLASPAIESSNTKPERSNTEIFLIEEACIQELSMAK